MIEGCEELGDLNATKTDAVHILNVAKGLGIPEENILRNEGSSISEIRETYKKLLKLTRKLNHDERPHTFIVYAGGHGASLRE